MEWNELEAREIMAEATQAVRITSKYVAKMMSEVDNEDVAGIADDARQLKEIIYRLEPQEISVSRQTPWITRGDVKKILATAGRLEKHFDIKGLISVAGDLVRQSALFLEMMTKHGRLIGGRGDDAIEDYLTTDQVIMVLQWVEEGKQRQVEIND